VDVLVVVLIAEGVDVEPDEVPTVALPLVMEQAYPVAPFPIQVYVQHSDLEPELYHRQNQVSAANGMEELLAYQVKT